MAAHVRIPDRSKRHIRRGGYRPRTSRHIALRPAQRGNSVLAIGRSQGARTTKLHRLIDQGHRPRVLLLSAGNINDIIMAEALVCASRPFSRLLADKGYYADHFRKPLAERGAEAVIPSSKSRRVPVPNDTIAYKIRNRVERMWCRLKDFKRVTTRSDKLARNYFSDILIAAACANWCNLVRTLPPRMFPAMLQNHPRCAGP